MKKLYRKGTVHPSPPPTKPDHLGAVLPAAILTLTTALSPEDSEVLLYLLSSSSTHPITTPSRRITSSSSSSSSSSFSSSSRASNGGDHVDHTPVFSCDCFTCYGSYWARWNTSPNRQLIHEILDAYEDFLARESKSGGGKNKRERKNNKNRNIGSGNDNKSKKGGRVGAESTQPELASPRKDEPGELDGEMGSNLGGGKGGEEAESGGGAGGGEVAEERGPVRRFVNFIGERMWGVWN